MTRPKLPKLAKVGTAQNPLRFTDILLPRRLKPGVEYEGWECNECHRPIAPRQQGVDRPALALSIKCPHCDAVQVRTWQGLSRIRFEPRSKG